MLSSRDLSQATTTTAIPPERFDVASPDYDRAKVRESLSDHGAVILTNVFPSSSNSSSSPCWRSRAEDVPSLVFPPSLLRSRRHRAAGVHAEKFDRDGGASGAHLPPHTDGYVFGGRTPDVVVLLCESPAIDQDGGGANHLVDGEAVVARLEEEHARVLSETDVDHTERTRHGFDGDGAEHVVPVLRRLRRERKSEGRWWCGESDGRFRWSRMVRLGSSDGTFAFGANGYVSCWDVVVGNDDDVDDDRVRRALEALDRAIFEEARSAVRVRLETGEALVVDNYRMLHGRESYDNDHENDTSSERRSEPEQGQQLRRTWRVWTWTTESEGLPPGMGGEDEITMSDLSESYLLLQTNDNRE